MSAREVLKVFYTFAYITLLFSISHFLTLPLHSMRNHSIVKLFKVGCVEVYFFHLHQQFNNLQTILSE
jgi:hypothetical protein